MAIKKSIGNYKVILRRNGLTTTVSYKKVSVDYWITSNVLRVLNEDGTLRAIFNVGQWSEVQQVDDE